MELNRNDPIRIEESQQENDASYGWSFGDTTEGFVDYVLKMTIRG